MKHRASRASPFSKAGLVALAILITVIAAGCKQTGPSNTQPSDRRFIGGTEGLAIQFFEGAPPSETYDGGGNQFGIITRVENMGETKVLQDDAKLKLTGFLPGEFNSDPSDMLAGLTEDVNGRELDPKNNELPGGITQVEFGTPPNNFDYTGHLSGNTPFTVQASICYKYQTRASGSLCVESDLLDPESKGSICESNDNAKSLQVSGAPVQFETTMAESVTGSNKVSFAFTVKKVKTDSQVYDPATEADTDGTHCIDENRWEDVVNVRVETAEDMGSLTCTSLQDTDPAANVVEGKIKLFSGSRQIVCTETISKLGDYESEVKISTDYFYKDYTQANILVRHITPGN